MSNALDLKQKLQIYKEKTKLSWYEIALNMGISEYALYRVRTDKKTEQNTINKVIEFLKTA